MKPFEKKRWQTSVLTKERTSNTLRQPMIYLPAIAGWKNWERYIDDREKWHPCS
jgi:hypothetical protein